MKSPAILFYTSDFMTGTMFLTNEETGAYIRLLCMQHQKGHLSEKEVKQICKNNEVFSSILPYLKQDKKGLYFNKRMEEEIIKRQKYSESRAKNRSKKDEDMKNISNTYEEHMENENENINENIKYIIDYLNSKTNKHFKYTNSNKNKIRARLNENFTVEDFVKVIDKKTEEWLDDKKMNTYLRPETLFGSKFESYLQQSTNNKEPEWFNKKIEKEETTAEELKEIEELLKEFE